MSDDKIPALITAFNVFDATHGRPAEDRLAAFLASLAASGYAVVAVGGPMRLEFASPHGTTTIELDAEAWSHVVAAAQEEER